MTVSVGVDGGQSTIRLRISGRSETLTRPGVSHIEADTSAALLAAVIDLWAGQADPPDRLVAGLTTIPASVEERAELCRSLAHAIDAAEVWVSGDDVTGHAGALGGGAGVFLAAGTGVACLAFDPGSRRARNFDGAGYLIGDEGGGFWLGRAAIRAAIAAHEGRGPDTGLAFLVAERYGPLDGLGTRLHTTPRAVDAIARAATLVVLAAEAGDGVATAILSDAAARLAAIAKAALDFLGVDAPVACNGRLLSGSSRLAEQVRAMIAVSYPDVRVFAAPGSSLNGACALASATSAGPYDDFFTTFRRRP